MRLAPDQLLRLPLAPLLLAQGLWVRRSAQVLPEPLGPRQGGDGDGLRLLILGDSSAAGVGAKTQGQALSGHLAASLVAECQLTWLLEAETGATTKTSLQKLDGLPEGRFDIALLVHGVNDTTRFTAARRFRSRQLALMDQLRARHGVRLFLLSGVPPMHHFPLLPQPLRWVLGCHANRLDRQLAALAAQREDTVHQPLNLPFDPRFVATDGFHPSPRAYRVWADMLARTIRDQVGRAH